MIHSTFFREKASGRQRRWGVILKNLLKKLLKLLTMRVTLVGVSMALLVNSVLPSPKPKDTDREAQK